MKGSITSIVVVSFVIGVTASSARASTCRMGDAEACPKACNAGDLRSCYFFARMLSDGNGVAKDEARSAKIFLEGCDKGFGDSCNGYGVGIRDEPSTTGTGVARFHKSLPFFEKGCTLGSTKACNNAAKIHQDLNSDWKRAGELFEKSCFLDGDTSDIGCNEGGRIFRDGHETSPEDEDRAKKIFAEGCRIGSGTACASATNMGVAIRVDPGAERARQEKFCALGEVKACSRLGLALMNGKGSQKDIARAREPLTTACVGGSEHGCRDLAELLLDRLPTPTKTDIDEGMRAQRKACDGGMAASCKRLADDFLIGQLVPRSVADAITFYQRACSLPSKSRTPAGCEEAGALAREQGKDGALLAEIVFREGCSRGDSGSCRGLQSLGKSAYPLELDGKDAVKNQAIARCEHGSDPHDCYSAGFALSTSNHREDRPRAPKYYELSCNGGLARGCQALGVSYNTGNGVEKNQARAAELFARACALGETRVCASAAKIANTQSEATKAKVKNELSSACERNVTEACTAIQSLE